MARLIPDTRDGLIDEARLTIRAGDTALADSARQQGEVGLLRAARAKAAYARASTLIQLAGYLGMVEDSEKRWAAIDAAIAGEREEHDALERQRQDDYIAGAEAGR